MTTTQATFIFLGWIFLSGWAGWTLATAFDRRSPFLTILAIITFIISCGLGNTYWDWLLLK